MKLISLSLHNFRKFKELEIEFKDGLTGFVGNNGAGKSTIFEAIGWVLYGNKASRTPKDQIKRQGAGRTDDCWVKLKFEMGGNIYEVFRIISGNSTDAGVKVNGLISASSARGVTSFIEKKLGMDYDSFYTSIMARQQELNALSEKLPSERKKSMMRMLKIDVLEDAIKKVREDRRNKERILDYIEKNLRDVDEIRYTMENYEKNLNEYLKSKDKIKEEMGYLSKKMEEIYAIKKMEKEKAEKFKNLEERRKLLLERRKNKLFLMEEKLKEEKEIEGKSEEYEKIKIYRDEYEKYSIKKEEMEKAKEVYYERRNIEIEMGKIKKEIEETNNSIKILEDKLEGEKNLKIEIENISEKLDEKGKILRQIEKNREGKIAEKDFKKENLAELREKLGKIKEIGPESNCPTCGRPLAEKYEGIVRDFEERIKKLNDEIKGIELEINEMEKEIKERKEEIDALLERRKEIEKEIFNYKIIRERIKNFSERKKRGEESLKKMEERLKEIGVVEFSEEEYENVTKKVGELLPINNKIMLLENEIKRLPLIRRDIKEIEEEIKHIENEIKICNEEIEKLDFDAGIYEKIEKEYEEIKSSFHEKRENFVRIEEKIEYIKKEIERLKEEIEEENKKREEIKKLKKEIMNLEMLAGDKETGLLNNFKNYLISKIGPLLSHYASHFFRIFTDGKYKEIELDENYNIMVYDQGEKFELERFSGGEKDLANLSLRLSISQLIAQRADVSLNFIALDEIFGSQDAERRRNIINALAELKNQFQQIFLITHIEEIKDFMGNIIKIYEDEEGISHAIFE